MFVCIDFLIILLVHMKQGKGSKSFREKYKSFWIAWVEKLLSLPRESGSNKRVLGHEIIRTVVDQMVALSSMAVVNVRDAVTEAALSVSQAVLRSCKALRVELETVQRQILADEKGRTKAQAQLNPKYQACLKQRDTSKKVHLICCRVGTGFTFQDWINFRFFSAGSRSVSGICKYCIQLYSLAPHEGFP